MTTGHRIAVVLVGLAVLVGAFLIAQSSGDEGDGGTAPQTTTPAAPAGSEGTGGTEAPTGTQSGAPPAPRFETIRIRDGAAAGEPRAIRVDSGDTVRLRFTSNTAQEIHVHGYDREASVQAGGSARMTFRASAEGVFEIESHTTHQLLAKLEVTP